MAMDLATTARGLLMLNQKLSPTTTVVLATATVWVTTARGPLTLSQKLSPTTTVDLDTTARGLQMLKLSRTILVDMDSAMAMDTTANSVCQIPQSMGSKSNINS